jgi:hypothetical protein
MNRRMLGLSKIEFGTTVRAIAKDVREWEYGSTEPPREMLAKTSRSPRLLLEKPQCGSDRFAPEVLNSPITDKARLTALIAGLCVGI